MSEKRSADIARDAKKKRLNEIGKLKRVFHETPVVHEDGELVILLREGELSDFERLVWILMNRENYTEDCALLHEAATVWYEVVDRTYEGREEMTEQFVHEYLAKFHQHSKFDNEGLKKEAIKLIEALKEKTGKEMLADFQVQSVSLPLTTDGILHQLQISPYI